MVGAPRRWAVVTTAVLMLTALMLATSCTAQNGPPGQSEDPADHPVIIGTGPEAESRLLAMIVAELVAREGFAPTITELADSTAARRALEVGDIDVLPGYTGQAWLDLGLVDPSADPRTSFARVQSADASRGVTWLRPRFELDRGMDGPPANATFGLFMRGVPSPDAAVRSMTHLASALVEQPEARVCVDPDFAVRPDGWEAVAQAYSIADRVLVPAGPVEAIRGVATGECMVGLGSATDGDAWAAGLQLLADPLGVFPAFVVTLQLRGEVADEQLDLLVALEPLPQELTTRLLGSWNGRVVRGEALAEVAADAAGRLRQLHGMVGLPAGSSG